MLRALCTLAMFWGGPALAAPHLAALDLSSLTGEDWVDLRALPEGFLAIAPGAEGSRWYFADPSGAVVWADVFDCPGPDGDGQVVTAGDLVVCARGDVIAAWELRTGHERFRVGGTEGYQALLGAGDRLLAATSSAIEVFETRKGRRMATWAIPNAALVDVGGPAALSQTAAGTSLIRVDPKKSSRKPLPSPGPQWTVPGIAVGAPRPDVTLVRAADGEFSAIDTTTGALRWHGGGFSEDTWPVGQHLLTRAVPGGGRVAISSLNPADRLVQWTLPWPADDLPWGYSAPGPVVITGSRHWAVVAADGTLLGEGDVDEEEDIVAATASRTSVVLDVVRYERGGKRGRRVVSASTRGHALHVVPLSGAAALAPYHTTYPFRLSWAEARWSILEGTTRDALGVLLGADGGFAPAALTREAPATRDGRGVGGWTWHRVMLETAAGALPLDVPVLLRDDAFWFGEGLAWQDAGTRTVVLQRLIAPEALNRPEAR